MQSPWHHPRPCAAALYRHSQDVVSCLERRAGLLSGGQKQRVAIARALVNEPLVILADEPTGNLDSKTSYEIMDLFQQLNDKGRTIVMVTHEPDISQFAKSNIVFRDGAIITNAEIKERKKATDELKKMTAPQNVKENP